MSDSTYRTASAPTTTTTTTSTTSDAAVGAPKEVTQVPTTVEPPFTEYENKKGKPYVVDYFDLGRFWDTGEAYTKEVSTINTYVEHLIHSGELNNTTDAVAKKMKSIEKMINVNDDDRKAARVGKVAAYMEFLIKADNIKKESAKYGMA